MTSTSSRRSYFLIAIWGAWLAFAVGLTAGPFLWHVRYFKSPGPQFYRIVIVVLLASPLLLAAYQWIRRKWFWRYELAFLCGFPFLAGLIYATRGTLVALWVLLAAFVTGRLIRRKLGLAVDSGAEEIAVSTGIGLGAFDCVLFLMGLCGWYYAWSFALLLGLPLLALWREARALKPLARGFQRAWVSTGELRSWSGALLVVFAGLFTLCSTMVILAPTLTFDVLKMHLPSAEYYASQHALRPVPNLVYSYFPQGIEILMTVGYSLGGQPAAQIIPPLFFALALLMAYRLARQCGADRFSALAGVLFAGTVPFLHWDGSVAKNDLALTFFLLAALHCYLRWRESGNFNWIRLGVFFVGMAAGVKHIVLFALPALALLYLHAVWRQPRRFRALAGLVLLFVSFGLFWHVRTFVLTGNPVYPETARIAVQGPHVSPGATWKELAVRYALIPWKLQFEGNHYFESPSANPVGIFLILFWPVWLLSSRRITINERICLLFAGVYLLYWASTVLALRYAVTAILLLCLFTGVRLVAFCHESGTAIRLSLAGAAGYCLVFALCGAMILEINAPQLRLFAGKIDNRGYLRDALATYRSLEFLRERARPGDLIFSVGNCSAAYAPDPSRFDCLLHKGDYAPAEIAAELSKRRYQFLIMPATLPPEGRAPIYSDQNFAVYRLGGK